MKLDSPILDKILTDLIQNLEIDKNEVIEKVNFAGNEIYQLIPILSKMIKTLYDKNTELKNRLDILEKKKSID